ncbi:MAG: hypothetical protein A3B73_04420 [Omnitrophica WOR_2 bacterium RIFCSPHIGHO2_02_FULL_63_39]|nr:MAG: hypothetical protein A3B73_04420 [Omnitrophica WOR_2 bacterium RIFCSPHIGHO2_02_FULL_63_39]
MEATHEVIIFRLRRVQHQIATTYDPVGNRLTSHRSAAHRYDVANRLLADDQFTYAYDANGNLTQQTDQTDPTQVTRYTYDVENQLTRIDFAGGSMAQYRYDGLGRRIEKAVSGTVLRYVYDHEDLLFTVDGANALQAGFLHGPGIDAPLLLLPDADRDGTLSRGEPTRRLLTDGLGSIIAVVDDRSGTLVERYLYESFGTLTLRAPDGTVLPQSAVGNPYGFTGREFDAESGLYYYRSRYYDPKIGRFLQEDPEQPGQVRVQGGRVVVIKPSAPSLVSQRLNPYVYVSNNPINLVDPYGLLERGTKQWSEAKAIAESNLGEKLEQARAQNLECPAIPGGTADESKEMVTEAFADEVQPGEWWPGGLGLLNKKNQDKINERMRQKYPDWPWAQWDEAFEQLKGQPK